MLHVNLNVLVTNIGGKVIEQNVDVSSVGFHMKIILRCSFCGSLLQLIHKNLWLVGSYRKIDIFIELRGEASAPCNLLDSY
jgi:hypothetical protein